MSQGGSTRKDWYTMSRSWNISVSWRRYRRKGFRKLKRSYNYRDEVWEEVLIPILPGLWLVRTSYL
jgi:hypothetical protein